MKKKILLICSLVLVVAIFVSICFGIIVPSFGSKNTTSGTNSGSTINRNYENLAKDDEEENNENLPTKQPDNSVNDNVIVEPVKEDLDFFVYDKAVTKTKEICGETTSFEIKFKLFVTNNTAVSKSILANAFSGNYSIGEYGLYYTFLCQEDKNNIELSTNETIDLDFVIKYIITDNENFNELNKYNLVLNYMQDEIISLSV